MGNLDQVLWTLLACSDFYLGANKWLVAASSIPYLEAIDVKGPMIDHGKTCRLLDLKTLDLGTFCLGIIMSM